jgi:poly-gamma-glutamate synthesis protein (capsule biosynthesis protein)
LGRDVFVSVYLPCRADDAPLPYVVLLHGSNRDDRHWLELGLADHAPAFAVVMPFGEAEANTNRFDEAAWGEALLDLLPEAEARWSLDPARRAIGGISRGGFWAYQVGLRHPSQFLAIGGHSAFFDRYHAPPEANPLDLALTLPPDAAPTLWLDRGADDYAAEGLDLMDARLTRAGLAHTYTIHPTGGHDDATWRAHLPAYLAFYRAALAGERPTAQPTNRPLSPDAVALFVPVAAFPSPVYDLPALTLADLAAGAPIPRLTVSRATRDALERYGVRLAPETRTLDDEAQVLNDLFRDRTRWALVPWGGLTLRHRVLFIDEVHPVDAVAAGTYPLMFESDAPDYDPARLSRVLVSGVTALARGTRTALDANGIAWAAERIAPLTQRADLFHISSEVSAIARCPDADAPRLGGNSSFCSQPEHLALFGLLGVDVVELSGNHNNDYGFPAYLSTLGMLREQGMATVGGGATVAEARAPFVWEGAGGSVAWLSCNAVGPYYALADDSRGQPGAAACDGAWLRAELPRLRAQYDVVVLTVQYLEFDQHNPTDAQRADFIAYAELGAHYVGGTHAHFPQALTVVEGYGDEPAFVHYGLGNFLFDQTFWAGQRFALDELYLYDGRLHSVAVYLGIIEGQGQPRLMTPTERENLWFVLFNQYGEFR